MQVWMPGVDLSQNFSGKYKGSSMGSRLIVIHTTEGSNWPAYGGGASAPHFTVKGDWIRQHFPINRSARALVNAPGGVETNTDDVIQIEIIGTCNPSRKDQKNWLFVPEAGPGDLRGLVAVLQWINTQTGIPLVDAAPRGWLSYPSSYGNRNGQRMTFAEWGKARGIVGHQHVPENSHGDPGNFNVFNILGGDEMSAAGEKAILESLSRIEQVMWLGGTGTPKSLTLYTFAKDLHRFFGAAGAAELIGTNDGDKTLGADIRVTRALLEGLVEAFKETPGIDPEMVEQAVQSGMKKAIESIETMEKTVIHIREEEASEASEEEE